MSTIVHFIQLRHLCTPSSFLSYTFLFLFTMLDTFHNKTDNGVMSHLNTFSNDMKHFVGSAEHEGKLNGSTPLSSLSLMDDRTQDLSFNHIETQNNNRQSNIETVENKDNHIKDNNDLDSGNALPSDGSSFPENIFFAKAILLAILLAFVAACALPYPKHINVISLYGKGLMEIWKRVGNIT